MRCLTLADFLRSEGAEVRFITRPMPGSLETFVESKGYAAIRLQPLDELQVGAAGNDDYSAWLGVTQETDAIETLSAIADIPERPDWMVVDHYGLDCRWEELLRPVVPGILVIDDLANRTHDCDILLDANFTHRAEARYAGRVPEQCRLLLGPGHALLRQEFRDLRARLRRTESGLGRILLFFGGIDRPNLTRRALAGVLAAVGEEVAVDVIAGGGNPHHTELANICSGQPNVTYFRQIDNMAERMMSADLAIGAGGTTTWERCALGLPSLVAALAENQEAIGEEVARYGVGRYLGRVDQITTDKITEEVTRLMWEPHHLALMGRNALALVDGRGVERVVAAMAACEAREVTA